MKQLLHTPEGVRDIYHEECAKKLALQNHLQDTLHLYGYQNIQTPTIEFFDVFSKEIGTISSKELYRFFDREGNTLVLRPDITPQIARVSATFFSEEDMPARVCYIGNTFVNHSSYQGRLKETTQLGAELVGDDSVEADAEMIAMMIGCLKSAGLTEFQINLSNIEFFKDLMEATKLTEDVKERLRELINDRNFFAVDELLESEHVELNCRNAFQALPELLGGVEVLEAAKKISPNEKAVQAVVRLEAIYELLCQYKVEQYITFDLSMCGSLGYYTGIVFKCYTYGTGDAVVKGGRYDHLIEKFGLHTPSIGFVIVIDELMKALQRQKIEIDLHMNKIIVLYHKACLKDAIQVAENLRKEGKNAEMIRYEDGHTLDFYREKAKKKMGKIMMYLQEGEELKVYLLEELENIIG